jgi:hypothetical protein
MPRGSYRTQHEEEPMKGDKKKDKDRGTLRPWLVDVVVVDDPR